MKNCHVKNKNIKKRFWRMFEMVTGVPAIQHCAGLGGPPGENSTHTFTLPGHTDRSLTALQSAEVIADHFATTY